MIAQSRLNRAVSWLVSLSVFLAGVVVFIYPIYWLATISLKTQVEAFRTPPALIFIPTFRHYVRLVDQAGFLLYFYNSIAMSVGATAAALVLGVPAAYSLSRGKFKGKNALLFGILATQMACPSLFIIPYFVAFVRVKLIDTRLGLIIISLGFALPLVIWSLRAFFDDIPAELEDAARIDGASDFQTFARIILPLVATGTVAAGITSMILCWNQFIFPLVLTRNRAVTATVALMKFLAVEAEDWGLLSSGSIVLTLPVVFFSVLIRKGMTRGLVAGAVKG